MKKVEGFIDKSVAPRIGKFIDRLTVTDMLNLVAFGAGTYVSYYGLKAAAAIPGVIPDWVKWVSPLSPFLYQLLLPTEAIKKLSPEQKFILALLGGYSTVRLAPVVVQALMEEKPVVPAA